jgi:hypothetical protein
MSQPGLEIGRVVLGTSHVREARRGREGRRDVSKIQGGRPVLPDHIRRIFWHLSIHLQGHLRSIQAAASCDPGRHDRSLELGHPITQARRVRKVPGHPAANEVR